MKQEQQNEQEQQNKQQLQETLNEITSAGIQADRKQLKKDMRAQFAHYREWIREYVVNSYDAMASYCRISGEQEGDEITITVMDDGKGMNRKRVEKYFTLYASEKDVGKELAIGTHGIGKLSIAAIPDQCRFVMKTSNGKEGWLARAGRLDTEEDIVVEQLLEPMQHGTTFRITFKAKWSLQREMFALEQMLIKYVRFLPLQVLIAVPLDEELLSHHLIHCVSENWNTIGDGFTCSYDIEVNGQTFEVVMNLGKSTHELYQNKVLISPNYNLLSFDMKKQWKLNGLSIRVNGSTFELPFGRHCLSDDEILHPLSRKIRRKLLPQFMKALYEHHAEIGLQERRVLGNRMEALTCELIKQERELSNPWCQHALIRTRDLGRLSLKELTEKVEEQGRFFVEDESNAGIDYTFFKEPVLQHNQPEDLIALLKDIFKNRCVSLQSEDLVFEKSNQGGDELSTLQKTFMENLGFHPELFRSAEPEGFEGLDEYMSGVDDEAGDGFLGQGLIDEVVEASQELAKMKWRVSFLVEKDFKTPSQTHLFIHVNDTIVLNLHHPLIKKLVRLTGTNPKLAGHWGISLCLEDGRNVFPYLSADTREELLMLDGMAKLHTDKAPGGLEEERKAFNKMFNEFRTNLHDSLPDRLN
jgi:hypothetical protein